VPDLLLQGATLLDGTVVDVRVRDGRIDAIGQLAATPGDETRDLTGYLLSVAPVEPHAHLDKAFLAERVTNRTGDLLGAVEAMVAARGELGVEDTIERAERAARLLAANGFAAVRSHAHTTMDHGLRSIEALAEVRRRVADVIDVQVVALCGWPVAGAGGASQRALLVDALAAGADLVGGAPHFDPGGSRAATEALLQIATDHGVGVDLHTDETLDLQFDGLSELAALIMTSRFAYPVTASHCVSLGMRPPDRQRDVAELVAAAGISVVALPATNLYLQGRQHQEAMPRGVTAVHALRAAGAVVAAGADNLQDPFNPVGRGCPFETAALMILTTHLLPEEAWETVSTGARRAIGMASADLVVGAPADLLAVRASTIREAIAFAPADRLVIRHGRVNRPT
jgi:cytosine/creatinine deaminase